MKIFFLQVLTLFALNSFGQIARSPLSNHYTGATTYSNKFADVFAFSVNQAALANTKNAGAGIYSERKFMLSPLSSYHGVVVIPLKHAGVACDMHYFGDAGFTEMQAGIAYGRKLSKSISIGAQVNYNQVRTAGYGAATAINFEIGTIWAVSEKVKTGMHIYNPIGGRFGKNSKEKLSSIYKAGIGYEASDQFFVSAELAKEEDKPLNVNASLQYNFHKNFLLRGGISSATANYFFATGISWKDIRLDVGTAYHQQLGFSPFMMLLFEFNQNADQ